MMSVTHDVEVPGTVVTAAYSLVYRGEGGDESPGGLELIVGDGSILFWSGTDWALRAERGSWPVLPTWAWPPDAWAYARIDGIGDPDLSEIISAVWHANEVGETVGVTLEFAGGDLHVRSGADFLWEVNIFGS